MTYTNSNDALEIRSNEDELIARLCAGCAGSPETVMDYCGPMDSTRWYSERDRLTDWRCDRCAGLIRAGFQGTHDDPYWQMSRVISERRPAAEHHALAYARANFPEVALAVDLWLEDYAGGYSESAVEFYFQAAYLLDPEGTEGADFDAYAGRVWQQFGDVDAAMAYLGLSEWAAASA